MRSNVCPFVKLPDCRHDGCERSEDADGGIKRAICRRPRAALRPQHKGAVRRFKPGTLPYFNFPVVAVFVFILLAHHLKAVAHDGRRLSFRAIDLSFVIGLFVFGHFHCFSNFNLEAFQVFLILCHSKPQRCIKMG